MKTRSQQIMEQSTHYFPGGVNSPVRAFGSVGGTPVVIEHTEGKWLTDVDGKRYVDFCGSWGPLILGHRNAAVLEALQLQMSHSLTLGAPSEAELKLAQKLQEWVPGLELMRFVSSGTEATMSAVRAARAATGRSKFIKFEGCYHGHADHFLSSAGSGLATLGMPNSAGVPENLTKDTLTLPFNDKEAISAAFRLQGQDIAAVILEAFPCNMGLVLPQPGYLECLKSLTHQYGSLLIFDEVITGLRVAKGGVAELTGVQPDLWTFGKILGGGLPAAAYGGRRDIMEHIAPLGKAYQAGTLSGNPLAMAAGLATLCEMERQDAFTKLEQLGQTLDILVQKHLNGFLDRMGYLRQGSIFWFFFGTHKPPQNFTEVQKTNMEFFKQIYHAWLEEGIYFGPSGYEVGFLNTCHQEEDLERMVKVIEYIARKQDV